VKRAEPAFCPGRVRHDCPMAGGKPTYHRASHRVPADVQLWLENDEPIMLLAVDGTDPVELTAEQARDLGNALIELADLADDGTQ
jgi:hypothetical protein